MLHQKKEHGKYCLGKPLYLRHWGGIIKGQVEILTTVIVQCLFLVSLLIIHINICTWVEIDSALFCRIPKCCLLVAKCCRHQGRRDAVRTSIPYRVDNRWSSAFITLLAPALAEGMNLFGLLPTTNHSMIICLFYLLLKPTAFINQHQLPGQRSA